MKDADRPKGLKMLKQTLGPMTGMERLEYLWEYYKYVLVILLGVILFIQLLITVITAPDVRFEGIGVNMVLSAEGEKYVTGDWLEEIGGNAKKEEVLYSPYLIDFNREQYNELNEGYITRATAMVAAKSIDYFLTDQAGLEFLNLRGLFQPLSEVLTQEQMETLKDRIVYLEQDGQSYPFAVDISDTYFAKTMTLQNGQMLIAFPGNTDRVELSDDFLFYLLAAGE